MNNSARVAGAALGCCLFIATAVLGADDHRDRREDRFLSFDRLTLGAVLERLGELSGEKLTCPGRDLSRRPLLVHGARSPDESLRKELAAFVGSRPDDCVWQRTRSGERVGWRLTEAATAASRRRRAERQMRDRRRTRLAQDLLGAIELADRQPDELRREVGRRPRTVAAAVARPAFQILRQLRPEQVDELLTGREVELPYTELSPAGKEIVWEWCGGRGVSQSLTAADGRQVHWSAERDVPRSRLLVRLFGRPDRPGIQISLPLLPGGAIRTGDVVHPPEPPKDQAPEWLHEAIERLGAAPRRGDVRKAVVSPIGGELDARISVRRAVIPGGAGRGPVEPGLVACDLSGALRQIAEQLGVLIIGDYDPCWDDYYSHLDTAMPSFSQKKFLDRDLDSLRGWEALDYLADYFGISWEHRGSAIWVRSPRVKPALLDGVDLLADGRGRGSAALSAAFDRLFQEQEELRMRHPGALPPGRQLPHP